ncbi:MAG: alpha/beta fold hydrolase [Geminicoccales bacterium]
MTVIDPHFAPIDDDNAIHVIHSPPLASQATFVFCNSMGATTDVWEDVIAPELRGRGYGTISFDYRGQGQTRFGERARLDPAEIISDIGHVLACETPQRPILCGLSIGGLFAARAWLNGAVADGIALINTLRKPSAQVEWINTLEARLIAMGGMPLVHDVLRPVLASCDQLARLRPAHLPEQGYTPWPADHPRRRLAESVNTADWDVPWEDLTVPTLVFTGLHDRLFRIQSDVDEILTRIPDADVIEYADGGHSLHQEFPAQFVADLVAFAEKLEKESP